MRLEWKDNYEETLAHHLQWWQGTGCVVSKYWQSLPAARPHENVPDPGAPKDLLQLYTDPGFRARRTCHCLSRESLAGDILPFAWTDLGPGSLACLLGAEPVFTEETTWYEPCLDEMENTLPLRFDKDNKWWLLTRDILCTNIKHSQNRYLTPCPDLVENLDILASLRGSQQVLMDMIERPEWVKQCVSEINGVYFDVYDAIYEIIKEEDESTSFGAFWLWGPGKTIKVQCDICAMLSPAHFEEFVLPALRVQCEWADNVVYHLDGSNAIKHLDLLLGIEDLDAIEFTPDPNQPPGSNEHWFGLYRRIREAGKSVQVVDARKDEVLRLVRHLGSEGFYYCVADFENEEELWRLYRTVHSD